MAASWWKLAFALGVSASFCAWIPSCTDNNESIFIRQMQALAAPQCTVTSDATALAIFDGLLDVALGTSYVAYPLIGNQLIARGDPKTSRAEPNRVVIQGAEVRLLNLDDSEKFPAFTVIASGTVDPTASSDASYGVTAVEVIPPVLALKLRSELAAKGFGASSSLKAEIKVFGQTLGGTDVQTGPYVMPMSVCYGCTVSVPTDAVDTTLGKPNCAKTDSGGSGQVSICRLGQDLTADCRLCVNQVPACTPCATDADCAGMSSTANPAQPSTCNTAVQLCQ